VDSRATPLVAHVVTGIDRGPGCRRSPSPVRSDPERPQSFQVEAAGPMAVPVEQRVPPRAFRT
jgi:hypothetical protein